MPLGLVALGVVLVGLVAGAALPIDERLVPEAELQERAPAAGPPQWLPRRAAAGAQAVAQPSSAQRPEGTAPASVHSAPASDPAHPSATVSLGGARASSGSAAPSRAAVSLEGRGAAFPDWAGSMDGLAEALAGLFKALRSALDVERGITVTAGGPVVAAGPVMMVPPPDPLHVGVQTAGSAAGAPPGVVQADGSALRIASLEQQLNVSLQQGDPTQIAQARFALAQALASDPTQQARALSLAEQARDDLSGATDDASTRALRQKLDQWISEHNSHVPVGSGGGKLTRSGDLAEHDSQVP